MIDLVVIGGGNMGAALVKGLLAAGRDASRLLVVDVDRGRLDALAAGHPGVSVATDLPELFGAGVVLAVKPAQTPDMTRRAVERGAGRVLSLAAGVRLSTLEAAAGGPVPVVRCMPNTPALVGRGMAALALGSDAGSEDLAWARSILEAVGSVVEVSETALDAVTGVTGSGPAYLFLVAEALIDAAVAEGLARDLATRLVRGLFDGVGAMLTRDEAEPAALRAMVTSPGGTTAAGLGVLEDRAVRAAFAAAVAAATRRSRELG